jgi:hypothetical protein
MDVAEKGSTSQHSLVKEGRARERVELPSWRIPSLEQRRALRKTLEGISSLNPAPINLVKHTQN